MSQSASPTRSAHHDIVDLHVDSIIQQRLFGYDVRRAHRPGIGGQPLFWHADVPRMQQARYRVACMGIHYFPWESEAGWDEARRQLDYLDALAQAEPGCLRIHTAKDWQRAKDEQLLGLVAGVEGAHMLNGRLERVEELARRGVAYLTLTHFSKNQAATPSMGRGHNEVEGLTGWGQELVAELERCQIAVDVAHVNMPGALDACKVAKRPVICTHTGAKGVHDHPRCLSDAAVDAIAATGGLIGVIFAPIFLTGRVRADTSCVLDHMDYLVERIGPQRVALGSDYDGWLPAIPSDHRDCRDIQRVIDGMYARGYTSVDVQAIAADNAATLLASLMPSG